MAFLHDISKNIIYDAYETRAYIHTLLVEEYEKEGLEYDETNNVVKYTNENRESILTDDDKQYVVMRNYHKMTDIEKKVHQRVLNRVYELVKGIDDRKDYEKFTAYLLETKNTNEAIKMIKADKSLIYDTKKLKDWTKQAEKIVKEANAKFKINIQQKNMLTIEDLERLGIIILGRAVELCPIETGFLRTSGTIYVFKDFIRIIFECPYGFYVHESLNNVHPFGQAKFLETAAQEILPTVSVWVKPSGENMVDGRYIDLDFVNKGLTDDAMSTVLGVKQWVEHNQYEAVYMDIDVNLNINNSL